MLQLAKLESGHMVLREEALSLREICQSILNEVHAISVDRNIKMEFSERDLTEPPIIIGDMDQTRKTILNLVGNSLKFTPPGGKVSIDIHKQ
jgi:signal transduction histidine kinase